MTEKTLRSKVRQLQELQNEIDTLTAKAEAIKNGIKAEMEARTMDELKAGSAIVRWKPIVTTRFDTKAFREAHTSLYNAFAVPSTTRRFTLVSA